MIILFLSHLSSNIAAGMSWSVPASVKVQSEIDDVLWINLSDAYIEHWSEVGCYHSYKEYGSRLHLGNLPTPFNKPDIVVFEGLYDSVSPRFARELRKAHVPYIIVPRCGLTYKAQHNHAKWKKRIANILLFGRFIKKATGIQYLTEAEYKDSGDKWNKTHFILPNGFSTPTLHKTSFNKDVINAVFIGRLDMFQKGLDYLLDACDEIQDELRKARFHLVLYGPERYQYFEIENYIKRHGLNDLISMGGETTGKEKEHVLLNSDLFILTSRYEGHPMGLIEALAYGVPVLATSGSNMSDEIKLYDAGWACDDTSKKDVICLLKQMIAERDLLNVKSECAQKLAKKYDWSVLARRLHEELSKLI